MSAVLCKLGPDIMSGQNSAWVQGSEGCNGLVTSISSLSSGSLRGLQGSVTGLNTSSPSFSMYSGVLAC